MTRRRSARAIHADEKLRAEAESMIERDETVTARALARNTGLGAASSITRDRTRRELLAQAQERQERLREWSQRSRKESVARLQAALAGRDAALQESTQKIELLIASHKALLLAVDEVGGTQAWLNFFAGYRDSIERLRQIGAVPATVTIPEVGSPPRPHRRRRF